MEIGGINFYEDRSHPRYRISAKESRASRSFLIRAGEPFIREGERRDAQEALLGWATLKEDTVTAALYISRKLPVAYPAVPTACNRAGEPYQFATEIASMEPYGRPEGVEEDLATGEMTSVYSAVRLEVLYESPTYFIRDDEFVTSLDEDGPLYGLPDEGEALANGWAKFSRYITKRSKPAPKTFVLRNGLPKFIADGTTTPPAAAAPMKEGLPISEYRQMVEYTWHGVPVEAIPEIVIAQTSNCVNDVVFDNYEPETLLLLSTDVELYRSPLGLSNVPPDPPVSGFLADVKYQCLWVPSIDFETGEQRGHNAVLRCLNGKVYYWRVTADGFPVLGIEDNAKRLYKMADFRKLFRPDQPEEE